jgi:hypothetical protein
MNIERGDALALAARWGFNEADPLLVALQKQIVSALIAGGPTRPLWQRYREVSDQLIEPIPDGIPSDKARAAREIVMAHIWIEGGDIPRGLSLLLLAEATARNNEWAADERILRDKIASLGTEAEYLLAEGYFYEDAGQTDEAGDRFEAAIAIYYEAENDDTISEERRGLLGLHTAEACLGLIRVGAGDRQELELQIVGWLESAGAYLRGTMPYAHLQALLNELAATDWWDAAVARQHA